MRSRSLSYILHNADRIAAPYRRSMFEKWQVWAAPGDAFDRSVLHQPSDESLFVSAHPAQEFLIEKGGFLVRRRMPALLEHAHSYVSEHGQDGIPRRWRCQQKVVTADGHEHGPVERVESLCDIDVPDYSMTFAGAVVPPQTQVSMKSAGSWSLSKPGPKAVTPKVR